MSSEHYKAFSDLKILIEHVLEQMEKCKPRNECSFQDYNSLLNGVDNSGSVLAKYICNTALAFRSDPSPTEFESLRLCKNLEFRVIEFLDSFLAVPRHAGKYFLHEIRSVCTSTLKSCLSFVEDLIELCQSVKNEKQKQLILHESALTTVAEVWEKGHTSTKTLPKNNHDACSKFILIQMGMVADAISELEDAKRNMVDSQSSKSDDNGEEIDEFALRWCEDDFSLLVPATGLMKTAKNLMKKIAQTLKGIGIKHYAMETIEDRNNNLDRLCDIAAKLSPASDELAATLYPPIEPTEVRTASVALIKICKKLLDQEILSAAFEKPVNNHSEKINPTETISKEEGIGNKISDWSDFLIKALNHNETQLNLKLAERSLNSLTVEERND